MFGFSAKCLFVYYGMLVSTPGFEKHQFLFGTSYSLLKPHFKSEPNKSWNLSCANWMDSLVKSKGFDPCVCVRVLSATMNWWGISILLPQLIWCLDMHLEILQASFRFDLFLCVCVFMCMVCIPISHFAQLSQFPCSFWTVIRYFCHLVIMYELLFQCKLCFFPLMLNENYIAIFQYKRVLQQVLFTW